MKNLKTLCTLAFSFVFILTNILSIGQADKAFAATCTSLTATNIRYQASDSTTAGQITVLQSYLNSAGYLAVAPTGYFGNQTLAAVKSFQTANGIISTGFVGALTKAKIREVSCGGGGGGTTPIVGCPAGALFNTLTGAPCSGTVVVNGCQNGALFNIYTGASCTGTTNNAFNLSSSVYSYNDNSSSINYTIYDTGNSYSYTIYVSCPSGVSVNYLNSNACGSIHLFSGTKQFTLTAYNNSGSTQNLSVRASAMNTLGNTVAEDTENVSISSRSNSSINVTNPDDGQSYMIGDSMSIRWDTPANTSTVLIELIKGSSVYGTISYSAQNTGLYTWTIPNTAPTGNDYKIKIKDAYNSSNYDNSDGFFSITQPVYSAKSITSFGFSSPSATGVVDEANKTIFVSVPFGTSLTSLTPTITTSGNSTITPASGVAQNFTTFKDYVVRAQDGSTQSYRVTVGVAAASSAKSVTSFNLVSPSATGVIDESGRTISLTVPFGTSLTALIPSISVSPNATISPLSGVAQNFTTSKVYTVKAQDNTTQAYTVTVSLGAGSSAKSINSFNFASLGITGDVNEANGTIVLSVPFGTPITSVIPTISLSANATVSPASGVAQNFTTPKVYTVKAQDNSTKTYTVTVSVGAGSSAKAINSFSFAALGVTGSINETSGTIALTVPFGTPLTSIVPTIGISANSTITPASGVAQNFSTPKVYTVKAQDNSTKTYTVTVTPGAGSSAKSITSFDLPSLSATGVVNETNKTIALTVPYGTSLASIVPSISLSANATVSPASGIAQNFTTPKVYTVRAQDGSTQNYTVTASYAAASTGKSILTFGFTNPSVTGSIDQASRTIAITVPFGTQITSRAPTLTLSPNATISPAATALRNFSVPVNYVVTAQDGTSQTYQVITSVGGGSSDNNMIAFNFTNPDATGIIDNNCSSVSYLVAPTTICSIGLTVPYGTAITSRSALVTLSSPSSTISPLATTLRNFTTPQDYVVTAQDGMKKTFRVTVTVAPPSDERRMTSFAFPSLSATGVITNDPSSGGTVHVDVPFGTNLASLTPTITVSPFATVSPLSGTAQNFTSYKVYTVKSQANLTSQYTVYVTPASGSSGKAITSFNFANPATTGVVDETAKTITLTVPFGTPLTSVVPTISLSPNATISPLSGVAQNFTTPKAYTVRAQDGSTQIYTVTVNTTTGSSAKSIFSFDFTNPSVIGVINETAKTVGLTVPYGTSISARAPVITVSPLATISPLSGVAQNFTTPKTYTVKAQDNSTVAYTVTVDVVPASSEKMITSFRFASLNVDGVINEATSPKTISLTVPHGTAITSLVPTITLSPNTTITPGTGVAQNFTTYKDYTVRAQDNSVVVYRATVTVAP